MDDSHTPSTYKSLTPPQRKHRKLLTDGSGNALWSESIEAVFVQGLREYWDSPWATYSRGRSRWRNQYLVDYLQNLGITRSKKQVASHIQVLRNVWKGEPEYHLLTGGEELFQEFVKQDTQEVPAFFPIDDHKDNSSSPDNPPPFVSPNLSSWDANARGPTFAGQGKISKSSLSSTMVPLVWSSDPFEDSLGSGHPNAIGITVEGPQDDSDPLSQGALG
ncbi:hypothetical protein B0H14DRAFT_2358812 [Mycena olivaceomarginata]|nr:hypothetical protein B0H14DRAFT_2358812 [Mycena olivaceomarginata]